MRTPRFLITTLLLFALLAVPAGAATGSWAPLWYDREHNVFLFLNSVGHGPRLRGGPTQTWAYRYRKTR